MAHTDCNPIARRVDELFQRVSDITNQRVAREQEALKIVNPWRYFAALGEVQHMVHEEQIVQAQWSEALNDLALCRQGELPDETR